jgi:hypothetical protein
MTFHTIKSSRSLSGINVSLRDGTIYADNMSLNNTHLNFRDELDSVFRYKRNTSVGTVTEEEHLDKTRDLRIQTEGIFYSEDYTFNDLSAKIENVIDGFGMMLSRTDDMNHENRKFETYLGTGAMGLEITEEDDKRHWMVVNPKVVQTDTPEFSIKNYSGSIVMDGKGVSIDTNASGLYLKGENMISLDTGGYINKYLSVVIYDNASSMYKPFLIPLMNPVSDPL